MESSRPGLCLRFCCFRASNRLLWNYHRVDTQCDRTVGGSLEVHGLSTPTGRGTHPPNLALICRVPGGVCIQETRPRRWTAVAVKYAFDASCRANANGTGSDCDIPVPLGSITWSFAVTQSILCRLKIFKIKARLH